MTAPPPFSVVAGATGTLGRLVVAELARRGHRVRALSRSGAAVAGAAETARADLRDPAALRAACAGAGTVVSAVGASLALLPKPGSPGFDAVDHRGTAALVEAARAEGVRRFAYVSVFHTPHQAACAYVRAHVAGEAAVRASGMEAVVVRPTGFFEALGVLRTFARLGLAPSLGDGTARSNPIAAADVAALVADAVEAGTPLVEAGGPDVLSRRAMTALAFAAEGRRPRFVKVPSGAVRAAATLVRPLDARLSDLLRFFACVSTTDAVAPVRGTRRLADHFRAAP